MKPRTILIALIGCLAPAFGVQANDNAIQALLITGGCCHNYPFQSEALTTGVSKMALVQWTVVNDGGS